VAVALGRLRNPAIVGGLSRLNRGLRRRAARIVAIGRDMADRLIADGAPASKIHVIPNWADGRALRPLDGRSALRREHGWEGRFVVMHSGNVGLSQDLETFLDAAERLRDEPDVVCAIVGDGAGAAVLKERASRSGLCNVRFLPYQPKAELADSLGAADVHLISLRPGLSGAIVPSKVYGIMAAGKPFLAAVDPGSEPALLAEEHGCGVRVDPSCPDGLADAIRRVRGLPLAEMGRRAREAFESRYDRPIAAAAYRRLLEETASLGPSGCR
jgi:glycosyltransferase involved in cell wall biosynthesis